MTDLQIAYLALGKVGPIVSSARVLAPRTRRGAAAPSSNSATPERTTG